jgi:hypothetical protein
MRILSDEPCKITFSDNIAGGSITLEFRPPTMEERIKFANSLVTRHGRKVEYTQGETRSKYGFKILTGITDGEFAKPGNIPISSNPQSADFTADWKELVAKYAPDVIAMLAMHVFENALSKVETEDDEENPT